jgi:CheY-like chemotaxis protein
VLRAIKNDPRTRAIPVVIMTASTEEHDMVNGYHLGTNAYIQKPVDFDRFQEIVEQLGLFWLLVNQPPPPAAFKGR